MAGFSSVGTRQGREAGAAVGVATAKAGQFASCRFVRRIVATANRSGNSGSKASRERRTGHDGTVGDLRDSGPSPMREASKDDNRCLRSDSRGHTAGPDTAMDASQPAGAQGVASA